MWYFKTSTRQCELFTYGGCDGNANRFESVEECEKTCYPYIDPNGKYINLFWYHCLWNSYKLFFCTKVNKIDEDPHISKPSEDICEAGKLRCKQLSEEATQCPYGLEHWVNSVGCEDCRCYDPCLPGTDQKSVCPADYQCTVDVITTESGDSKYRATCRPGMFIKQTIKLNKFIYVHIFKSYYLSHIIITFLLIILNFICTNSLAKLFKNLNFNTVSFYFD